MGWEGKGWIWLGFNSNVGSKGGVLGRLGGLLVFSSSGSYSLFIRMSV